MPGIRLIDLRAALAALGLAGLAALTVAITTHLPMPAPSGPAAHTSSTGLSRLQSLPLQAQSVISSTIAADSRAFAARRTASGWGLSGGGVRADFRARRAGDAHRRWHAVAVARGRPRADLGHCARQSGHAHAARHPRVVRRRAARHRAGLHARAPSGGQRRAISSPSRLPVGGSLRAQAAGSAVNFVGSHGDDRGAVRRPDRGRRDRAARCRARCASRTAVCSSRSTTAARATRSRSTRWSSRAASSFRTIPAGRRDLIRGQHHPVAGRQHRADRGSWGQLRRGRGRGCLPARPASGASRARRSFRRRERRPPSSARASRCHRMATPRSSVARRTGAPALRGCSPARGRAGQNRRSCRAAVRRMPNSGTASRCQRTATRRWSESREPGRGRDSGGRSSVWGRCGCPSGGGMILPRGTAQPAVPLRCPSTATPRSSEPDDQQRGLARPPSSRAPTGPGTCRRRRHSQGRCSPLAPVRCGRGPVLGRKHGARRRAGGCECRWGGRMGIHTHEWCVEPSRREAGAHERERERHGVREQRGPLRRRQHCADRSVHRGRRRWRRLSVRARRAAYGQCNSV